LLSLARARLDGAGRNVAAPRSLTAACKQAADDLQLGVPMYVKAAPAAQGDDAADGLDAYLLRAARGAEERHEASRATVRVVGEPPKSLPSQRGETWNDTEAINRHREMTPSQRVALAIEASRAALMFAEASRVPDDQDQVRS
jgi:hypothetical protein